MTQHDDDPFAPKTEEAPAVRGKFPDNPVSADAIRLAELQSDNKVVVTLKGGASFSDPWIVIHANSVEDADSQMDAKLAALMEKTQKVAKKFVELGGGSAPTAAPAPTSNVPAGAQSAPNNETRQCKHGAMTYKTGSKGGRTWRAFMCPTPKGAPDQCEPEWIRD